MSTFESLTLPPVDDPSITALERDSTYRREYVRQLTQRLFPNTLYTVREMEGVGAGHFEDVMEKLKIALRIINVHEQPHFARSTGIDAVPTSAVDGLYTACRSLAVEALYKGSADRDMLNRLASAWCTTMKLMMMYDVMSSNTTLRDICLLARQWMVKCVDTATDGHITWPFWKTIKSCANWCCMFHDEDDFGCSHGSPRFGHLLAEISDDQLITGITPALMSWTYAPCLIRSDTLTYDGSSHYTAADFLQDVDGDNSDSDSATETDPLDPNRRGSSAVTIDSEGRPIAVIKPICSWIEFSTSEVPHDLYDGPPFSSSEQGPGIIHDRTIAAMRHNPDVGQQELNSEQNEIEDSTYDVVSDNDGDAQVPDVPGDWDNDDNISVSSVTDDSSDPDTPEFIEQLEQEAGPRRYDRHFVGRAVTRGHFRSGGVRTAGQVPRFSISTEVRRSRRVGQPSPPPPERLRRVERSRSRSGGGNDDSHDRDSGVGHERRAIRARRQLRRMDRSEHRAGVSMMSRNGASRHHTSRRLVWENGTAIVVSEME